MGCRPFKSIENLVSKSDVIFITTPDREIERTGDYIASFSKKLEGKIFVHCSGALSSDILFALREKKAIIASFHPLQSFASVDQAIKLLPGIFFAIEGDTRAIPVLKRFVFSLDGEFEVIRPFDKPLYHAAACVASNYLVTLVKIAVELFEEAGIASQKARYALLPLIKGTISNIEKLGIPKALTGPISRSDRAVVEEHLRNISRDAPRLLDIYKLMAAYTIPIAMEKGTLQEKDARKLMERLM